MPRAFHAAMGVTGFFKGKLAVYHRAQRAARDHGPDVGLKLSGVLGFDQVRLWPQG